MFNYPVEYTTQLLGELVTESTVARMKKAIRESARNIRVRNTAVRIISDAGCKSKDYWCEANAIYEWFKQNYRYIRDIHGTELIHSPLVALDIIERGDVYMEDCDGATVLLLSLYKSVGFPVAIRIAAYNGKAHYGHVYGLVNIYGRWVPVEGIKVEASLGWEAPNATKIRDYIV